MCTKLGGRGSTEDGVASAEVNSLSTEDGESTEDDGASIEDSSARSEEDYPDTTVEESNEKAIPVRNIIELDQSK